MLPKEASRYLTIYELQADSSEDAAMKMNDLRQRLRAKAASTGLFAESGSTMYVKIRDVKRE